MAKTDKIKELLTRGVEEIIVKKHLENTLKSGNKLRVKFGIDPTTPFIHLGHTVPIRKLKQFQQLGHKIVFLVGNYTARIGDPSEKEKTRPSLSKEQVKKNAETYFEQAFKILDKNKTEVHMQSEWYDKFDLEKIIRLLSKSTLRQIMTHETFRKRIKKDQPLGLHELIYPLLQGYDSIALKADVEVGSIDQKFNLLMGRELQKKQDMPPQDVLITKYLIGVDGKEKMSKTLGNYIAILDKPDQMYGRIMSIPDSLILSYFELATDISLEEIKELEKDMKNKKINPRDLKSKLAKEIVTMYHSKKKAIEAEKEFNRIFREQKTPSQMPKIKISDVRCQMSDLLVKTKLAPSKSEAKRLITQGGVKIDNKLINDPNKKIKPENGMVVQVGKRRFVRIKT